MPDQPLIRNLKEGETFQGFLLAQEAVYKVSTKGSEYLELKLSDASGDLKAENSLDQPVKVAPVEKTVTPDAGGVDLVLPPYSFTVLRVPFR